MQTQYIAIKYNGEYNTLQYTTIHYYTLHYNMQSKNKIQHDTSQ